MENAKMKHINEIRMPEEFTEMYESERV